MALWLQWEISRILAAIGMLERSLGSSRVRGGVEELFHHRFGIRGEWCGVVERRREEVES